MLQTRTLRLLASIGLLGAALPALADPVLVYSNDFETAVGAGWTGSPPVTTDPAFTTFVGRMDGNSGVELSIPAPPPPAQGKISVVTLTFDLYVIDSWDGDDAAWGPDRFQVLVNGRTIFDESFSNQHAIQSFREPDVGRSHLGFHGAYPDSIYRDITVSFEPGDTETLWFYFRGQGLQFIPDESWGLDNVRVHTDEVPTPGAAALLGLAGALAGRRRRRA